MFRILVERIRFRISRLPHIKSLSVRQLSVELNHLFHVHDTSCKHNTALTVAAYWFWLFRRLINFCQKHIPHEISQINILATVHKAYGTEKLLCHIEIHCLRPESRRRAKRIYKVCLFTLESIYIMFPWLNLNNAMLKFWASAIPLNYMHFCCGDYAIPTDVRIRMLQFLLGRWMPLRCWNLLKIGFNAIYPILMHFHILMASVSTNNFNGLFHFIFE